MLTITQKTKCRSTLPLHSITHSKICIIGGGTAGVNLSAQLSRFHNPRGIRIFEPSKVHYYQPGFTLMAADRITKRQVIAENWRIYNKLVKWTQAPVRAVNPQRNLITTDEGEYSYDQLVICSGVECDWQGTKGVKEALEDNECPVGSIYSYKYSHKTRLLGRKFKGGNAIFTEPASVVKGEGASQKIMYLLTKEWIDKGIVVGRNYFTARESMFPISVYSEELSKIADAYDIKVHFKSELVEVDKLKMQAVFKNLSDGSISATKFDFLHVSPPSRPSSFIKQAGLSNESGYVNIDKATLQHTRYPNVWSLGDCSSLPVPKSAAAVYSQTDVLVKNLNSVMIKEPPTEQYEGYSCCPLFVGGGKLMMAESVYDFKPTNFADQFNLETPSRVGYLLQMYLFPYAYWYLMPRGIWSGRAGITAPE